MQTIRVVTINDYRQMRATTRGVVKRDRTKLKRQVKLNTLRELSNDAESISFQVRRTYRKLWHEAHAERERLVTGWRAIHATA